MNPRHDWNSWDHYLQIHTARLRDYDHFILLDDVDYTVSNSLISFHGSLYCLSGIRIDVEKDLSVEFRRGRAFVRTTRYKYHALYARSSRNLIRYDNAHIHAGHSDRHHKHLYDLPAGHPHELNGRVAHVGEDGWPTLADFIDEVIARFHTGEGSQPRENAD